VRLTKEQAEKYVAYRTRYLFGTGGPYKGPDFSGNCSASGVVFQQQNQPVSFLRHIGKTPLTDGGSFLNVDQLKITDSSQPDGSSINEIHHSDSLIYASYAALCFASEYSITRQEKPLQLCVSIVKAFQRLGTYQQGFGEKTPSGKPHGFMLRADSPDDATGNDKNKDNFCVWDDDPDNARNLEPSYDQYCAVLSNLRLIQVVLSQTPTVSGHEALRHELEVRLAERVRWSTLFLAGAFWTILFINRDSEFRTADRGAYCIHAAYPFAKIAVLTVHGELTDYFQTGFSLKAITDFPDTADLSELGRAFSDGVANTLPGRIVGYLLDQLTDFVFKNVIGGLLDEVIHMIGGEEKVRNLVKEVLKAIAYVIDKINRLATELVDAIAQWTGLASGVACIPLSMFLHRYYSKFMLGSLPDGIGMRLEDFLALFGIPVPSNPHFVFPFKIKFEFNDFGVHWERSFPERNINISFDDLWKIPIPIDLLDPLGLLVTGIATRLEKKPDLQMLIFLNNAAAHTFDENGINPVDTSVELQNCLMMALTYRFFPLFFTDGNANLLRFHRVMEMLDSAPITFPHDAAAPWNQNFRWMRGINPNADTPTTIYAGMDYMLPLMLAASHPADHNHNQLQLLEALAVHFKEEDIMGPFKLPFQGSYSGRKKVFEPKAAGTQNDTIIYLGVAFDRGRGDDGHVQVFYKNLQGAEENEKFSPNDPAKLIAVPLLKDFIIEAEITTSLSGYFLIQTSD
jgi:hypothetical protein